MKHLNLKRPHELSSLLRCEPELSESNLRAEPEAI